MHPDRRFADCISQGVWEGFRIGFDYTSRRESASRNMRSTVEHPEAVYRYLEDECSKGRVLGPFPPSSVPQVHVSRLGVVPKKGIDKWRLILDLSSPEGRSVNDGIRPELCSLSYVSVDDAARMATRAGQGALLAKVDIKSAYRLVPVHPEDRLLLGMAWNGAVFVDTVLPFGLRSAPKIFTALADALEWMIRRQGIQTVLHYLDDFLIVGQPNADQCAVDLQRLLEVFASLRVPVAMEKLEGPTTRLVFLGIELDTKSMCMRLPPEKLEELRVLLGEWQSRKFCRIRELRSLVGKLQHACKVVRPGRTFAGCLTSSRGPHPGVSPSCASMQRSVLTWPGGGCSWPHGMECHCLLTLATPHRTWTYTRMPQGPMVVAPGRVRSGSNTPGPQSFRHTG